MEHKLIQGGEQWLAFARSRIKALRATGQRYASQRFTMPDGASVNVQIVADVEYIRIEGGGRDVCVLPNVAYAVTVPLVDGKEEPRSKVKTTRGLRTGGHGFGFNNGALGDYSAPADVVWGTSPFSELHIEARSLATVGSRRDARVYVDDVLVDSSVAAFSVEGDALNGSTSERENWVFGCASRSDIAVVLVQTKQKVTQTVSGPIVPNRINGSGIAVFNQTDGRQVTTSGSTSSNFYMSTYVLDANGQKVKKAIGGNELTHRKIVGKQTTFDGQRTSIDLYSDYVYDGALAMNIPQTHHLDGSWHLPEQTSSAAFVTSDRYGNLILGTEQVIEDGTVTQDRTVVGGYSLSRTEAMTRTHSAQVTFVDSSGITQEEAWSTESEYMSTTISTHLTSNTNISGNRLILRGLVAGDKTVCIAYSLEHFPVPTTFTDHIDVVDYVVNQDETRTFTKRKTIELGDRTGSLDSGYLKFRGAAILVKNYIWCTQYCLNIDTEQYMELPGFVDGRLLLVNANGQTSPCTDANYLASSANGKAMTYYWLFLNQTNIDKINANIAVTYPLQDGIIKRYRVVGDPGSESVVEDADGYPIAIEGTIKDSGNDLHGATLRFA